MLVVAPGKERTPLLESGRQGGELHRKYKVYLDSVGVAKVPEDYEERLTEMFPGATSIFAYARWTRTIWRYPSWSATFSGTAMT